MFNSQKHNYKEEVEKTNKVLSDALQEVKKIRQEVKTMTKRADNILNRTN